MSGWSVDSLSGKKTYPDLREGDWYAWTPGPHHVVTNAPCLRLAWGYIDLGAATLEPLQDLHDSPVRLMPPEEVAAWMRGRPARLCGKD